MTAPLPGRALSTVGASTAPLERFMQTFDVASHPLVVAVAAVLILVVYEWRRGGHDLVQLGKRLGVLVGVIALGRLPEVAYVLYLPIGFETATTNPPWHVDVVTVVGFGLTAVALYAVWRYLDWGRLVPGGAVVVVATLAPYGAIAPFWDISGHVTFNTAVAVYLTAVDRRFAPAFLVALVTIVNRPFVGAHTWLQSVAGFALGLAVAGGVVVFVLDDDYFGPGPNGRPSWNRA